MTDEMSTLPKPFVFVLMPFDPMFNAVYAEGIKAACEAAGAYCERVDQQIFFDNVLHRIYNQISKADIIVADMSRKNANVFYEVGYAHALNKTVILTTDCADDIPYDLKHYSHIVYNSSIPTLKAELERKVRWCIDNPREQINDKYSQLTLLCNGHRVKPQLLVTLESLPDAGESGQLLADLRLTLSNDSKSVFVGDSVQVGIEIKSLTSHVSITRDPQRLVSVSPDSVFLPFPLDSKFVPGARLPWNERLIVETQYDSESLECCFQIVGEFGKAETWFDIHIHRPPQLEMSVTASGEF